MEKKGMFYENQLHPEDGMFMKCAEPIGSFINPQPKPQKPAATKPAQPAQPAQSEVPSTGVPTQQEAATATPNASMGCGPKLQKHAAEGPTASDIPGMFSRTGKKLVEGAGEGFKQGFGSLASGAKRLGEAGKAVGKGAMQAAGETPAHLQAGLKHIEGLPPWAHAAIMGAGGVYTYSKAKNMIKRMAAARNVPPPADSVIANAIKKAGTWMKRLRGR